MQLTWKNSLGLAGVLAVACFFGGRAFPLPVEGLMGKAAKTTAGNFGELQERFPRSVAVLAGGKRVGIGEILKIADPVARLERLLAWSESLEAGDFAAICDLLQKRSQLYREDRDLLVVLRAWAKKDPLAAAKWASASGKYSFEKAVGEVWATRNLDEAVGWGIDHDSQAGIWYGALGRIAAEDPQRAKELLMTAPDGMKIDFIRAMSSELCGKGMGFVKEWAKDLPDEVKDLFLSNCVVTILPSSNDPGSPESACELLGEFGNEQKRRKAGERIAVAWLESEPEAAVEWIGRLPDAERLSLAFQLLEKSVPGGHFQVESWLLVSSGDPVLAEARSHYVSQQAPSVGLEFILELRDEKERASLTEKMAGQWLSADPDGVRKWIEAASEAEAEEMKAILEKAGGEK